MVEWLARSTAVLIEDPGSNLTADGCVQRMVAFIATATAICSLGHGLRLTAVLRSTQPCIASGSLSRVPASAEVSMEMTCHLCRVAGKCGQCTVVNGLGRPVSWVGMGPNFSTFSWLGQLDQSADGLGWIGSHKMDSWIRLQCHIVTVGS